MLVIIGSYEITETLIYRVANFRLVSIRIIISRFYVSITITEDN